VSRIRGSVLSGHHFTRATRAHPSCHSERTLVREESAFRIARVRLVVLFAILSLTTACGYHTTAKGTNLPQVHTLAVPAFTNQTQTYRIEQVLTSAVVRELTTRTQYKIVNEESGDADATLKGVVVTTQTVPVTYDSVTGRASTALVTVSMKISLVDNKGILLFENPNYVFREEYQISSQVSSFFEEESPAVDRLSRDFARSLVSTILEGF
jgi:outer membrane lipopolysaccharide assembly protein LptE/RlpB